MPIINNSYNQTISTTTTNKQCYSVVKPSLNEFCGDTYNIDCILYSGPDNTCYNIKRGDRVKDIFEKIIDKLGGANCTCEFGSAEIDCIEIIRNCIEFEIDVFNQAIGNVNFKGIFESFQNNLYTAISIDPWPAYVTGIPEIKYNQFTNVYELWYINQKIAYTTVSNLQTSSFINWKIYPNFESGNNFINAIFENAKSKKTICPTTTTSTTTIPTTTLTTTIPTTTSTTTIPLASICWVFATENGNQEIDDQFLIGTSPATYNGKVWYGDSSGKCVYWDTSTNKWVYDLDGLGGGAIQSTLDNDDSPLPASFGNFYAWDPSCDTEYVPPIVCNSVVGSCTLNICFRRNSGADPQTDYENVPPEGGLINGKVWYKFKFASSDTSFFYVYWDSTNTYNTGGAWVAGNSSNGSLTPPLNSTDIWYYSTYTGSHPTNSVFPILLNWINTTQAPEDTFFCAQQRAQICYIFQA